MASLPGSAGCSVTELSIRQLRSVSKGRGEERREASDGSLYGSRVAVAFVPAAQVWPPAFQYIARSTTIG